MPTQYYSGQGVFMLAEKHATTGEPLGFVEIGNVPEASIDIEVEKDEHKESMSGQRAVDVTVIKSKKGRLTMSVENFQSHVLALGLHGTSAIIQAATRTDDVMAVHNKKTYTSITKWHATPSVVVKHVSGTPTYVANTDYTVDATDGSITALSTGAIQNNAMVKVTYAHLDVARLEVFQTAAPVRWVRFVGVNTVRSLSKKVVDIYKVAFDPVTGYSLISDDIQALDLSADILFDETRPETGSRFMRETDHDPVV